MTVAAKDRPLNKVREEVIDQLILNYSHGEISSDAFERRLDEAYATDDQERIMTLVADLPLQADARYDTEKAARLRPRYTAGGDHPSHSEITCILSNEERGGEWIVPKSLHLKNYLGNITLDFTNAVFTSPEVIIEVKCILGNEKIYVPEGCEVITETSNIMGSISNHRVTNGPCFDGNQAPKIYIRGTVFMGNVEIKLKRTMKQKLRSFADDLRAMFDDSYSSDLGSERSNNKQNKWY